MKNIEFENAIEAQISICRRILTVKAEEYAHDTEDRLAHFKVAAALQDCTPEAALMGMLAKQLVSVTKMCINSAQETDPRLWREKITDSINYLLILSAMETERLMPGGKKDE